jgi:cytochrome c5
MDSGFTLKINMKKLALTFITVSSLAILVSCSYNKKELPKPVVETVKTPSNPTTPVVPTPVAVTYTSHVKTIIDNNCIGCHVSGGVAQTWPLTNYASVKTEADDGDILLRAIDGGGSGPMPPSGLMPQTTLDTLQMWLDQGALQ